MNSEKLKNLLVYCLYINERLATGCTKKHRNRQKEYKQYLERELDNVTRAIEKLKLGDK